MTNRKKQDDIRAIMREIKNVWDLLAFVAQLVITHIYKIIALLVVIGMVLTGLSIKYKDFEITKDPIEVQKK
ncbi:hypothetical protein GWN42_31430 [candidate division KSB1 bacterium]|nr:hypothetical protein [Phycisphaerae bacterium]NIQ92571.1 hypothetical protein [Deltaproteobacteria bacterium]NIV97182.1 hypothetical protein [candidate division KSB1 bacterium]